VIDWLHTVLQLLALSAFQFCLAGITGGLTVVAQKHPRDGHSCGSGDPMLASFESTAREASIGKRTDTLLS
jgi:hypothetical protein